jgi:hypothetical protein
MVAAGPLSAEQLAAFEQDGVVTLDTPFTAAELDALEVWMQGLQGLPRCVCRPPAASPALWRLTSDCCCAGRLGLAQPWQRP